MSRFLSCEIAFTLIECVAIWLQLSENWSARLEYIYAHIEDDDFEIVDDGTPLNADVELDMHIVRAGVAYHF